MALVSMGYGPTMGQPNMGNIFGDAWRKIKSDPLVLAPPLWLGKESLKLIPPILQSARASGQEVIQAFRPAPPPSQVDAITAALTGSGGAPGGEPGSSSLPIILGAGALGLVLILALGKKKKP